MPIFSKKLAFVAGRNSDGPAHFESILTRPISGWHMFELALELHFPLSDCTIVLHEQSGKRRFSIKVQPKLASKRVLYLDRTVKIEIFSENNKLEAINIESARLSRLARCYAKKLILKKLVSSHPKYSNLQKMDIAGKRLPSLWRDYCVVFRESRRLVRYMEWVGEFDAGSDVVFKDQFKEANLASTRQKYVVGEWVFFLDKNCILSRNFHKNITRYVENSVNHSVLYTDSDRIDEFGFRKDPQFNPDWNRDLFYSKNYLSGLFGVKENLINRLVNQGCQVDSISSYELILRCLELAGDAEVLHIPLIMFHRLAVPFREAGKQDENDDENLEECNLLNDNFKRIGVNAAAEAQRIGRRVFYNIADPEPLVSIIVPSKNKLFLLRKCIESIVQKTSYPNYEIIIIDNGSDEYDALDYLDQVVSDPVIRVIRDPRPFNYSSLNNVAVNDCKGTVIALLNNDVEVIAGDWLTEMVSHALRPEVGAVGAKLLYPDNTIQHAGVVLGLFGTADHVFKGIGGNESGYQDRAMLTQSYMAVTGACLVVRKSLYLAVGGLNELDLPVACNDIDFCLKLVESGYLNVWTPYAVLFHHESVSRGLEDTKLKQLRAAKEVAYMHQRWGRLIKKDPAYNPNLSLISDNFSLAWPPRLADYISDN